MGELRSCRGCGRDIRNDVAACPWCDRPNDFSQVTRFSSKPGVAAPNNSAAGIAVIAVVAVLWVAYLIFDNGSSGGDEPTATTAKSSTTIAERDAEAFDICKGFVKDRLKSPSTAKFRNFYEDDGEVVVTGTGPGPYTVVSSVDSENSFGAKLRSSFTCKVTLLGTTWTLDDIRIV